MRCSLLLTLLLSFIIQAGASAQKISVRVEAGSLDKALQEIIGQSDVQLVYNSRLAAKIVCAGAVFEDKEVGEILDVLLAETGLAYKFENGIYMIGEKSVPAPQQQKNVIKGKVKDSNGMPLPGVSVLVKGTTVGVATDVNGNFELMLAEKSPVLVFSFIGMKTKEVTVEGNQPLDIVLEDDTEMIEEVVITGYQAIQSGRATGSFQILKSDNMDNIVATDFTKKIEGAVPGLMVDGDGKMLIRGKGTFQASTDPLIVVDGFPMESSTLNLNPADIEQITVLKDAASASIYGVRGANGVVVITTKRGSESDKISVNASANVTVAEAPRLKDLELLSAAEHVDLEYDVCKSGAMTMRWAYGGAYTEVAEIYRRATQGLIDENQAMAQLEALKSYDNQKDLEKYFYQRELLQQYNVSMRGGSAKHSFYAAAGFNREEKNVIGNENWRANFILNNDLRFGKAVKLQLGLKGNYYKQQDNGEDVVSTGMRPYVRLLDDKGNYVNEYNDVPQNMKDDLVAKGYLDWSYNRLQNRRMRDNTTQGHNISANLNLSVDVLDGLNLSTGFVYETGADKKRDYSIPDSYNARHTINRFTERNSRTGVLTHHIPKGGILNTTNSWLYNWTWRGTAAYTKSIADFDFSLSTGLEFSTFRNNGSNDYYYGYDPQTLVSFPIDLATLTTGVRGYDPASLEMYYDMSYQRDSEDRYASFFALANVTYKKKYDLFGSYRLDKTNLFGRSSEYRDNPAYSIGAKWALSSESFFDADWVSRLAVKLSYGVSGNIDKTTSPYLIGSEGGDFWTGQPALTISSPENPLLTWEKSYVWNAGVEFSLWGDRLSGNVEFYNKQSDDILAIEQVDYTSGWGGVMGASMVKNSASVVNRGVDLNLNGVIVDKTVRYSMGLVLAYNHNEVTKINRGESTTSDYLKGMPLKGQPIDYVFAYRNAGLDEAGNPMVYDREGNKYSWTDLADLSLDDIDFVGRSTPPVFGSWTNTLKWKDLTFDFMFTYKFGHKIRKPYTATTTNVTNYFVHESLADRWKEAGDENKTWIPKISGSPYESLDRGMAVACSDRQVDDGAIIRLRSLNLGYNFNSLIKKNSFIKDLNLRFTAENLFYWSKSGYDTDRITWSSSPVNIALGFPTARRYTFSLQFQF